MKIIYVKSVNGINKPMIYLLTDFIKSKGYLICNKFGIKSDPKNEDVNIGILMENPGSPIIRSYFWGLFKVKEDLPRVFLGYFKLNSINEISFFVFGEDNKNVCLSLSSELKEYIKELSFEQSLSIEIPIYIESKEVKYEDFPQSGGFDM